MDWDPETSGVGIVLAVEWRRLWGCKNSCP